MQEYYGESAKRYGQTRGKRLLLMPAIGRHLPPAKNDSTLLDVGCGNGDLYSMSIEKGYRYSGLDISDDMLERARADFPQGVFEKGDATRLTNIFREKFDIVVVSMLFPSLGSKENIINVLRECNTVMKEGGHTIIAVTHPSFDHYMQSILFQRKDVEANFKGYFESGSRFTANQTINDLPFTFEDYHWTMADYVSAIDAAGLRIRKIDECRSVSESLSADDTEWAARRDRFPTYCVIVASR